jgi:hypothetical protein
MFFVSYSGFQTVVARDQVAVAGELRGCPWRAWRSAQGRRGACARSPTGSTPRGCRPRGGPMRVREGPPFVRCADPAYPRQPRSQLMPARIDHRQDQPIGQTAGDIAAALGGRGVVEADRVAHLAQLSDQLDAQRLNLVDTARIGRSARVRHVIPFLHRGVAMPARRGRLV